MCEDTLRDAAPEEDEALASVVRRAFAEVALRFSLTATNCPNHPSNCRAEWIARHRDRGARYSVLVRDGVLAGCVALERSRERSDLVYLERLAVVPEWRGRGLGDRLVAHAHGLAVREWGARRVEIGIIAEQHELEAWYERRGYAVIGTRRFAHLPFLVLFMGADL